MDNIFLLFILMASVSIGVYQMIKIIGPPFYTNLNIYNWVYLVEFTVMGCVSPFFIMQIRPHSWAISSIPIEDFPFQEVVLSLSWCAIAIPIGISLGNSLMRKFNCNQMKDFNSFLNLEIEYIQSKAFYFFFCSIFTVYAYYLTQQIGFIPQFKMLSLNAREVALLRGQISHNLPSNIIVFRLIGLTLSPVISYMSLSRLVKKPQVIMGVICLWAFTLSIYFNSLNLNKSSLAYIAIGTVATLTLSKCKIGVKSFLGLLISIFLLLGVGFRAAVGSRTLETTFSSILSRITISQTYGNYVSFYLFPKYRDHLGFRSLTKQIRHFGIEPEERASRIMMEYSAPEGVKKGTAGEMVSTFFAEAWANWGIIGLLLSPLLVGVILSSLVSGLTWLPKSDISIGLLGFLTYTFGAHKGISKIILPRYFLTSCTILVLMYYLRRYLSRKT